VDLANSSLAYSKEQILLLSEATLSRLLRLRRPSSSEPLPSEFDLGSEKIDSSSGLDFWLTWLCLYYSPLL